MAARDIFVCEANRSRVIEMGDTSDSAETVDRIKEKMIEIQQILDEATNESDHPVLLVIPSTEKGIGGTQHLAVTPDGWRARDTLGALEAAKIQSTDDIRRIVTTQDDDRGEPSGSSS